MRPRHLAILLIALASLLAPPRASAAEKEGAATAAIKNANTRVRELLSTKADPGSDAEKKIATRVTTELRGLFDIGDLAKRALVDHWAEMTPKQRTELVDTLRLIVERNYISQLRTNLNYDIVYQGEEPQGEDVVVKTVIKAQRSGRPIEIPVTYILHSEGSSWRAFDVVTDDVSLLKNYRSQFNKIIAKDGADGLIKRMKAKLSNED